MITPALSIISASPLTSLASWAMSLLRMSEYSSSLVIHLQALSQKDLTSGVQDSSPTRAMLMVWTNFWCKGRSSNLFSHWGEAYPLMSYSLGQMRPG